MTRKKIICIFFIVTIMVIILKCTTFNFVNQPETAEPNSNFDVEISLYVDLGNAGGDTVFFGIQLPIGWTVEDSISYSGLYEGVITYSPEYSDSMNNHYPEAQDIPPGYYWWIAIAEEPLILDSGEVFLSPRIFTNNKKGQFYLSYLVSTDVTSQHYSVYDHDRPISVGAPSSITVTNTNESGPGSFREALLQIADDGEINFDLEYPDTIVVDSQLVIQGGVNINGPGKDLLTISGKGECRVLTSGFFSSNNPLFTIRISGLTIANGWVDSEPGAGIRLQHRNLIMDNVNIFDNYARRSDGGGIYVSGDTLKLSCVNIYDNSSEKFGGGIYSRCSEYLELSNSFICKNTAYSAIDIECEEEVYCNNVIRNATIAQNNNYGLRIGLRDSRLNIVNSILWNRGWEIYADTTSSARSKINIAHSCIEHRHVKNTYSNISWLEGNNEADPQLFHEGNGIYSLQENSPCIDAGIAYYDFGDGMIVDLNDNEYSDTAPDIGAYEYGMPTEIDEVKNHQPGGFALHQNYPNPFNPATTIKYSIPAQSPHSSVGSTQYPESSIQHHLSVSLKVYDILGKEVATLVNEHQRPGHYEVKWDASGKASGIYLYTLKAGQFTNSRKMILLR